MIEYELHGSAIFCSCGIGWSRAEEEGLDGEEGKQGIGRSGRGGRGGNLGRGGNIGSENAGGLRDPPSVCWNDKGLRTFLLLGFENSGADEGEFATKCCVGGLFLCSNKRLADEIWMLLV